jgi:hypothetical protein
MVKQDLEALPAEAYNKSFGGVARTVADFVYEAKLVNDHVAMVMRCEEPFPWPEDKWITAPADFRTKDEVTAGFAKSSQSLIETVEAFSVEDFDSPLPTDEGETTRAERCRFMELHLWYHSGQLNFIQTLLGDAEWHWN